MKDRAAWVRTERQSSSGRRGGVAVLVVGGAGYIGAHVVRELRMAGEDVVVVDDMSTGRRSRVDTQVVELDVAAAGAEQSLASLMRSSSVESVIHLAAKKDVGESVRRPTWYFQQNVGGLGAILGAMELAGVGRLVFSSSAAVYGEVDETDVGECAETAPISPYGQTKLVGEWMVNAASAAWGLRATSLRYFNVAGSVNPRLGDESRINVVTRVLDLLRSGRSPVVFGDDYDTPDGTCIRDYVHVGDLAEAHLAALGHVRSATEGRLVPAFNVGTGVGVSVLEMIQSLGAAVGREIDYTIGARRPGDPVRVVADVSRINDVLGWRSTRGLESIASSAWEAFGA
jgi:UDP-glucose 4-epimerase